MHADPSPSARRRLGPLRLVLVVVGLFLMYQGVMWVVRDYTSGLIAAVEGRPLPEFSLQGSDGVTYSPATLRGKPAILNFFRSRCHGCDAEYGDIRALAAEVHPGRATMLGVMVDEVQGFPPEVTAATLRRFGFKHPIVMADGVFVDAFHGAGWSQITPITYVVDANGVVTHSFRHPYSMDELRAAIP